MKCFVKNKKGLYKAYKLDNDDVYVIMPNGSKRIHSIHRHKNETSRDACVRVLIKYSGCSKDDIFYV